MNNKPGDLCKDNGRLCVLVKVGTPEDTPAVSLMNQAGILQPFGWFLDLEEPTFRYVTDSNSGSWVANLFTRNLDVVEWIGGKP